MKTQAELVDFLRLLHTIEYVAYNISATKAFSPQYLLLQLLSSKNARGAILMQRQPYLLLLMPY